MERTSLSTKNHSSKLIQEVFGNEKTIFIKFPPKSRFIRQSVENHPDIDEVGRYNILEKFTLDKNYLNNSSHENKLNLIDSSTIDTPNTNNENQQNEKSESHIILKNRYFELPSTFKLPLESIDFDTNEALISHIVFPVRNFDNMDLLDSFVKNQVFQYSEQFSFLRLYGLVNLETGRNILFQEDDDFYKVKSIPMSELRDGDVYELIIEDKRFALQQDVPKLVRDQFREEFDMIMTCSFDMNKIQEFHDEVRKKREEMGIDIESLESMKNEEEAIESKSLENPSISFGEGINSLTQLKNSWSDVYSISKHKLLKQNIVKIPKYRIISLDQVERYYSMFFYTEMIAIRDLIESKMQRNPTIVSQLEFQYELQIEAAWKKRNKLIEMFMEMDMNRSGYIIWEEFSNHKSENYIQHQTVQMKEKYFKTE